MDRGTRGVNFRENEPALTNPSPAYIDPSGASTSYTGVLQPSDLRLNPVDNLIAILTKDFPFLTNAPSLLNSMNAQMSFKRGETSKNVSALLERIQFADPNSPDIDEDNLGQSWGHYQFTAGGLSLSSSLTTWEDVGSVTTAFKLVAAALKTCQEARMMCTNAGTLKTGGFISDVYLEKIVECLQNCWVGAGGTITSYSRTPVIPTTPPSYRDVAMSPPRQKLLLKFKRPTPITDVFAATSTSEAPTSTSSEQPAASTEPTHEPSAALVQGIRADAASLKLLQVLELLAWMSDNKLAMPKSKRKDDLITAIVKSSEFAQVTRSTIQEIVENRKSKKAPKTQLAAP
ncbi:hypothetical protein BJY52DRAFT_1190328 [Lactarius psammicola]|nr:hypothetical protein BJY52DRAFT_1190328 [Lactarius psammicola]